MAMDAFSASLMKDKREIVIAPTIYTFDTFGAFAEEFKLCLLYTSWYCASHDTSV